MYTYTHMHAQHNVEHVTAVNWSSLFCSCSLNHHITRSFALIQISFPFPQRKLQWSLWESLPVVQGLHTTTEVNSAYAFWPQWIINLSHDPLKSLSISSPVTLPTFLLSNIFTRFPGYSVASAKISLISPFSHISPSPKHIYWHIDMRTQRLHLWVFLATALLYSLSFLSNFLSIKALHLFMFSLMLSFFYLTYGEESGPGLANVWNAEQNEKGMVESDGVTSSGPSLRHRRFACPQLG